MVSHSKKFKLKLFVAIVAFLIPVSFASAQSASTCAIQQPKSQKGSNLIFFSFFKKYANLWEYIPPRLVVIDPIHTKDARELCLTDQTYRAFLVLNNAVFTDTGQRLLIEQAWRNKKTQAYFAKYMPDLAAPVGRSEHQLGTAVDLNINDGATEEKFFVDSPAYAWMQEHAASYGFVQSFSNEPWHWRFVGPTMARMIVAGGQSSDEVLFARNYAKGIQK